MELGCGFESNWNASYEVACRRTRDKHQTACHNLDCRRITGSREIVGWQVGNRMSHVYCGQKFCCTHSFRCEISYVLRKEA